MSASTTVFDDIQDYEDYGLEDDEHDDNVYRRIDELHGRPRITSISNPLSALGFQYFSSVVRPLTLRDSDPSNYIEHVLFALRQFDIAALL